MNPFIEEWRKKCRSVIGFITPDDVDEIVNYKWACCLLKLFEGRLGLSDLTGDEEDYCMLIQLCCIGRVHGMECMPIIEDECKD